MNGAPTKGSPKVVEVVQRRVLGALRFLDATTRLPIDRLLAVRADGVRFVVNHRGFYVIATAPGLAAHVDAFDQPPSAPAVGTISVEVTVEDPGQAYVSRRCTVRLPLDPDPSRANEQPNPSVSMAAPSLFRPIDVILYPAPIRRVAPSWSIVRARVSAGGSDDGLPGALIRVLRAADDVVLARGMSDPRGETLVAVPGLRLAAGDDGDGNVLATETEVVLEAVYDPTAGDVSDPDQLEAALNAGQTQLRRAQVSARLAPGQVLVKTLAVWR